MGHSQSRDLVVVFEPAANVQDLELDIGVFRQRNRGARGCGTGAYDKNVHRRITRIPTWRDSL